MRFTPSELKRKLFFMLFDIIIISISSYIAYALRFDFDIPSEYICSIYITIVFLTLLRVLLYNLFRVYDISWRHFGFKDMTGLVYVTMGSTLGLLLFSYLLRWSEYVIPRSIIPIEFFISLVLILALRASKRLYLDPSRQNSDAKPTLIIANLDKANAILHTINQAKSDYIALAIVDEKEQNRKLNGVNVYSWEMFEKAGIECEVAIVDESVDVAKLYSSLSDFGVSTIRIASDYGEYGAQIKDISLEDLLARRPQDLDKEKIKSFLKDRVVLVTGAGGSIGSEICRQCEIFGVAKLLLLDNSEYNLYSITEEITQVESVSIMQNIVDRELLKKTFAHYKPEIVIHAAAYKHVPLVEENIQEAITNNIIGTKNLIDISLANGVEKFVMISTDKAVRPTNVMGTTKRICELYAQNSNGKGTDIVAVRFGNVLGSSGSVIPKFKAQIAAGKNITVTHPEITRYFMLIPEACELVLQAGAIGSGGEIFILDMGEPIKIIDLARRMIELSGKPEIEISFSGLRPGEKLYEELLIDETDCQTEYDSITVAKPTYYDIAELNADIKELLVCENKLQKLKEIVPEFSHKRN